MSLLRYLCRVDPKTGFFYSINLAGHSLVFPSLSRSFMASSVSSLEKTLEQTQISPEGAANGTAETPPKASGSKYKIYTRTGDSGQTSLYNGSRKPKTDFEFEALGDVDELNSAIGVAREFLDPGLTNLLQQLEAIQSRLIDIGSSIATPLSSSSQGKVERVKFPPGKVQSLEQQIDEMDQELPPLKNFILPSGGPGASFLHVARGVCRRAERKVVHLVGQNQVEPEVGRYMNRLSDYLFTAARFAALKANRPETIYKKVS